MSTPTRDLDRSRSSLSIYLSEIGRFAPLQRRDERALPSPARAAGVDPSRHGLVTANLAFVVRVARQYVGLGPALEDLISEGNVGLLEAARHFDPARGTRFITYAVWWIRKAILNAVSNQAASVRLPHTQRAKIRTVLHAERQLSRDLGRDAGRDEIARHLNTSIARIDSILKTRMKELSVDQTIGGGSDLPIHETLADARTPDPEAALIRSEDRARIRAALRVLGERERLVLADRFGLRCGRAQSLREIGARLGLSREAIRLIEKRAKKKLRRFVSRRPRRVAAPAV